MEELGHSTPAGTSGPCWHCVSFERMVYAGSAALDSGDIRGALVTRGNITAGGADARIVYDRALLDRLRLTSGSFVRVPGSWRDFP